MDQGGPIPSKFSPFFSLSAKITIIDGSLSNFLSHLAKLALVKILRSYIVLKIIIYYYNVSLLFCISQGNQYFHQKKLKIW